MTKSGKHCGKRRNCPFWAISSFVTMFSKSLLLQMRQKASIWGKGLNSSILSAMEGEPLLPLLTHLFFKKKCKCEIILLSRALIVSVNHSKRPHWIGLDMRDWTGLFPTIFLLLLNQILCCGCSKESSHWDDSFEYPQHRVRGSNKDFRTCKTPLIWGSGDKDTVEQTTL